MKPIDRSTPIALSLVIVIIGGVVWLTSVAWGQKANTVEIQQIKSNQTKILSLMNQQQVMLAQQKTELIFIKETVQEIKKKVTK